MKLIKENKDRILDGLDRASLYGYSIIKDFFNKDEINNLKKSHLEVFSFYEKSRGNKIVELSNSKLKNFDLLNSYKTYLIHMNLKFKKKFYLDKVWFEKKFLR